jgi:hypothetical protein
VGAAPADPKIVVSGNNFKITVSWDASAEYTSFSSASISLYKDGNVESSIAVTSTKESVTFTGLTYGDYEVAMTGTGSYSDGGSTASRPITAAGKCRLAPPDVVLTAGTMSTDTGEKVFVQTDAQDWVSIKGTLVIKSNFTQISNPIDVKEVDQLWEEDKDGDPFKFKASTYTAVLVATLSVENIISTQTATSVFTIPLKEKTAPNTVSYPDVQLKSVNIKYDGAKKVTQIAAVSPERLASIQWLASTGITVGSGALGGKATFKPQASVTRGAMAQFLQKLAGFTDSYVANIYKNNKGKFSDAAKYKRGGKNENVARFNAIIWLDKSLITSGCNKAGTLFCPDSPVTRGAMAQFMHRFVSLADAPASTSVFPDVSATDVKIKYDGAKKSTTVKALDKNRIEAINWLAATGVTQGSGIAGGKVTFKPQDPVTRGAMAQFMHKLAYKLASTTVVPT